MYIYGHRYMNNQKCIHKHTATSHENTHLPKSACMHICEHHTHHSRAAACSQMHVHISRSHTCSAARMKILGILTKASSSMSTPNTLSHPNLMLAMARTALPVP